MSIFDQIVHAVKDVAEVTTDDSVDPYSAGFAVNQVTATNINVASATYIFLAIS